MDKLNNSHGGFWVTLKAVGYLLFLQGTIILVPLLMLIFWPEEKSQAHYFVIPGVISIFVGYFIKVLTKRRKVSTLRKFEGQRIVLTLWVVAIIVGSVPFLLCPDYTLSQSFFEAISGFTTTGFTVTDVDNASHMILMYRSLLHLIGGVGLILVLTSILSRVFGMQMFSAEGHGDKLTPSPLYSARTIILIYGGIIIGGAVTYVILGMNWFDAVNFSISAVSTGGFSPRSQSIGYYSSIPIDIATMILMLVGATNFSATVLLIKGKIRTFLSHYEVITTLVIIAVAVPIVFTMTANYFVDMNILQTIDASFFHVISMVTTTGFSTIDSFLPNSKFALPIYFVIMFIGGHSGSTAGGIKISRFAIAMKSMYWDIRENIIPKRIFCSREITKFGKREKITPAMQSQNFTYILLYIFVDITGAALLTICGFDFTDSLLEFTSALGTTGLSFGIISRASSPEVLWIINAGMIVARLELNIFIFAAARTVMDLKESAKSSYYKSQDRKALISEKKKREG